MTLPQHEYAKDWGVLIVDDEEDNLYMAQLTLEFWGADVRVGKNGIEGLKLLETFDPTVILLDLSMPEMDGWTMHKKVREQPKFDNVPIIALTAHAMSYDKSKVMDAGFDGYITKPFMIDSFMEYIRECVERRQKLYGSAEGTGESVTLPEISAEKESGQESDVEMAPQDSVDTPETSVKVEVDQGSVGDGVSSSEALSLGEFLPETDTNHSSAHSKVDVQETEVEKEEKS